MMSSTQINIERQVLAVLRRLNIVDIDISNIRNEINQEINEDTSDDGAQEIKEDPSDDGVQEPSLREVSNILNHRCVNNIWEFLINFKGCKKNEWVLDTDCLCESVISTYLHSKNINTHYLLCRVSSKNQTGPTHVSLDVQSSELLEKSKNIIGLNDTMFSETRTKVFKISQSAYRGIPNQLLYIGDASMSGDIIMVYRMDRLSRNIVLYLSYLEELNTKGVKILSFTGEIYYHEKQLVFIQGILDAQKESHELGKRIKSSIKIRRERGDESLGSIPYGKKFKRNENTNVLSIVEDVEALDTIRFIIGSENPNKKIASTLNKMKNFKKGRSWSEQMIKNIKKKNKT